MFTTYNTNTSTRPSRRAWALAAGALVGLAACTSDEPAAPGRPPAVPNAAVNGGALDVPRFGFAWSDREYWVRTDSVATPSPAYSYNSTGRAIKVSRAYVGNYDVDFYGLQRPGTSTTNPFGYGSEAISVTAYAQGSPSVYCAPLGWGSSWLYGFLRVRVSCSNTATKSLVDSRFSILVVGDGSVEPRAAWGVDNDESLASATPDPRYSFNSSAGLMGVSRVGLGDYEWRMGTGAPQGAIHLVNAQSIGVCTIGEYKSLGPRVRCFDDYWAAPNDKRHQVIQLSRGRPGKRFGFAWADQPTRTTAYAPYAGYAYNSSGGTVQVQREGAGVYAVRFAGLQRPSADRRENVQVSAFANTMVLCSAYHWYDEPTPAPGLLVRVRCANPSGQPVDSRFNVMVIE